MCYRNFLRPTAQLHVHCTTTVRLLSLEIDCILAVFVCTSGVRVTIHLLNMSVVLIAGQLLTFVTADLPVATVLHGEPNASASSTDCVSWWCPQLIVTSTNTTILSAQCKSNKPGVGPWQYWIRSHDSGRTWSNSHAAQRGPAWCRTARICSKD